MITGHKSYVVISSYPMDTYAYHAKKIIERKCQKTSINITQN